MRLLFTFPIFLLLGFSAAQAVTQPEVSAIEPRSEAEARLQNRYADKISPEIHQRWIDYVAESSVEKQVWLRTLEEQLGGFYFPRYLNTTLFGPTPYVAEQDSWAYVKDDPSLPRVLIIGDSISRAYTAEVRRQLIGKANVHRAPANCGPTEKFLTDGEIWLQQNGSNRWDYIIFNFGIHDGKKLEGYETRLHQIIARLRQTGARDIFWVRTTPWGLNESVLAGPEGDASRTANTISDQVAAYESLTVLDAHAVLAPLIPTELNRKDYTHWSEPANRTLGQFIAKSLAPHLRPASP